MEEQEIREAYEEATVDAYGDYKQHTSLLTAIGDELAFPFRGKVLGEVVNIVGMEWPESDKFGLDLLCDWNGEQHRIKERSVELLKPFPEVYLFIAAYLDWKCRF